MSGVEYLYMQVSPIPDKSAFLQETGIPGVTTLKKIISEVRRMLVVPDSQVLLFALGQGAEGFRIDAYGGPTGKICWQEYIIFLPIKYLMSTILKLLLEVECHFSGGEINN